MNTRFESISVGNTDIWRGRQTVARIRRRMSKDTVPDGFTGACWVGTLPPPTAIPRAACRGSPPPILPKAPWKKRNYTCTYVKPNIMHRERGRETANSIFTIPGQGLRPARYCSSRVTPVNQAPVTGTQWEWAPEACLHPLASRRKKE